MSPRRRAVAGLVALAVLALLASSCGSDVDRPGGSESATASSERPTTTTEAPATTTTLDPTAACIAALPVRQRVAQLGGRLEIQSSPGKGTELLAELPV